MSDEYHPGGYVGGGPIEVRVSEGEEIYTATQVRSLLRKISRKLDDQSDITKSDAAAIAMLRVSQAIWDVLENE